MLNPDGIECPDIEALDQAVLLSARDTLGNDVKANGLMDLRYRIDAEDDAGSVVHSLPFAQAVEIIG